MHRYKQGGWVFGIRIDQPEYYESHEHPNIRARHRTKGNAETTVSGFLGDLEESVPEGREVALMLEYESDSKKLSLQRYVPARGWKFSEKEKRNAYVVEAIKYMDVPDLTQTKVDSYLLGQYRKRMGDGDDDPSVSVFASKKYKPVALKVKPVYVELPEQFRIKREIRGDPLEAMPCLNPRPLKQFRIKHEIRGDPLKAMLCLNPRPPDFVPTGRYTQE